MYKAPLSHNKERGPLLERLITLPGKLNPLRGCIILIEGLFRHASDILPTLSSPPMPNLPTVPCKKGSKGATQMESGAISSKWPKKLHSSEFCATLVNENKAQRLPQNVVLSFLLLELISMFTPTMLS